MSGIPELRKCQHSLEEKLSIFPGNRKLELPEYGMGFSLRFPRKILTMKQMKHKESESLEISRGIIIYVLLRGKYNSEFV